MALTHALAIDCEMIGGGPRGNITLLGRVSVVNENLLCIYDQYVKYPRGVVTDFRTPYSGIRPWQLEIGKGFDEVRETVRSLIEDCLLVGHDLDHDLRALQLDHPENMRFDSAMYPPFVRMKNHKPSLRYLALNILGCHIQKGEHCSVEDARTCMKIYQNVTLATQKDLEKSHSKEQTTIHNDFNEPVPTAVPSTNDNKTKSTVTFKRVFIFSIILNNCKPSLKFLALKILCLDIQNGEHSSREDAMACMGLYKVYQQEVCRKRREWARKQLEYLQQIRWEYDLPVSDSIFTFKRFFIFCILAGFIYLISYRQN